MDQERIEKIARSIFNAERVFFNKSDVHVEVLLNTSAYNIRRFEYEAKVKLEKVWGLEYKVSLIFSVGR